MSVGPKGVSLVSEYAIPVFENSILAMLLAAVKCLIILFYFLTFPLTALTS